MEVYIFEGIATSGKSTVTSSLRQGLHGLNVILADESETHIPITKEKSDKHIDFFKNLIIRTSSTNPDILIFDRLYLTQACRASCGIGDYSEIEEMLSKFSALTIFLEVDENVIEDRIIMASEHRGSDYFKSRGETAQEKAQYYINQQRNQLEMLKHSKLPYKVINTTNHDYQKVVEEIHRHINKK